MVSRHVRFIRVSFPIRVKNTKKKTVHTDKQARPSLLQTDTMKHNGPGLEPAADIGRRLLLKTLQAEVRRVHFRADNLRIRAASESMCSPHVEPTVAGDSRGKHTQCQLRSHPLPETQRLGVPRQCVDTSGTAQEKHSRPTARS